MLDQIPVAVFLLDASRCVVWMSRGAQALLQAESGIGLDNGRLTTPSHAETRKLDEFVERAVTPDALHAPQTIALSRVSDPHSLIAVVRRLDRRAEGAARAVIFLSDPKHDLRASRARLEALFHLTHGESELVALLAAGHSLRAAASQLKLTGESARTYLKRAFQKTGTRRQAELVRLAIAVATAGPGDA